ncbi:hypothetical protein ACWEOE_41235 [Amycolatopsis sp. NPDC004368]
MSCDFAKVPQLAEKINREVLKGADPERVFRGWYYGFSESTGFMPDTLAQLCFQSGQLAEACLNGLGKQRNTMPPLEALYGDLRNLGKIFAVSDRAEQPVKQPVISSHRLGSSARRLEAGRSCGIMQTVTAISIIIAERAG